MGHRSPRSRTDGRTETVLHPHDLPNPPRRRFLAALGGAGLIVLAGCVGDDEQPPAYTTYLVRFTDQDIEVEVRDDAFIWDQADAAGVDIPYRCGVGRCGQCTIKYDGDANDVVAHDEGLQRFLEPDQLAAGWILTCVAHAQADFEAVVAHPDD